MLRYAVKRFLTLIPVIVGISFIIFSIMVLTPGDPARLILGMQATNEEVHELREQMGLNDNFFVRYGRYVLNALKGDFGKSYRSGNSVIDELTSRIPCTLILALGSTIITVIIGIPVGVISAVKQYSIIDGISLVSTLLLTSMPAFWLGLMLILLFSLKLDLLPATGIDSLKNYILPWITMSSAAMAALVRMTRSNMLEVIRQDYIRTAKAKGAGEGRVIFKHALRNALLPIITLVGLNFGIMMGGALITESVFAMPGLGTLLITAVRMKDTPMVMASVLFIAIIIGIINLAVDLLYSIVDPRLKSQFIG